MGTYDTVHTGDRCIQVMCLTQTGADHTIGDTVTYTATFAPSFGAEPITGLVDYQIHAAADTWIQIRDRAISAVADEPADDLTRVDTYGVAWNPDRVPRSLIPGRDCVTCWELRGRVDLEPDDVDLGEVWIRVNPPDEDDED